MHERVRIFTDTTGAAHTAIESHLEDEINEWLQTTPGRFLRTTQSESLGTNTAHLNVAVSYVPESDSEAAGSAH